MLSDDSLFQEATAAWNRGQPEAILPKLDEALRSSTDYRLWHIHGLILRSLERHEEALKSLVRAVELAPNAPNPAHAYARTRFEAGLPSVDAYIRAVRLSQGSPEILLGLTAALVSESRVEDALAGLEQSLARTPHWTAGHIQLSKLRWMEGERLGFTRSFDEALKRTPQNLELRREQLRELIDAKHWDDAFQRIVEGRSAVAAAPLFDFNEAIIHSELGDTQKADILFDRFANISDPAVQIRRIRHFLRSGRAPEAASLIDPWLGGPNADSFWPYASIAWRMINDPRSKWLEDDENIIGIYDLADEIGNLDDLAQVLRHLHTAKGEPLEQSLRGGTQTDGNLFQRTDPMIGRFREVIRKTVAGYINQLPPPDPNHPLLAQNRNRPIRFDGAWSVCLHEGGYHANHVHPLGWISSAFYIILPEDVGKDDAGFLTLGEAQAELKLDLEPIRMVEPKPGRLVLFPSWMWHGTRPFGIGERMTVAFDVAIPN